MHGHCASLDDLFHLVENLETGQRRLSLNGLSRIIGLIALGTELAKKKDLDAPGNSQCLPELFRDDNRRHKLLELRPVLFDDGPNLADHLLELRE